MKKNLLTIGLLICLSCKSPAELQSHSREVGTTANDNPTVSWLGSQVYSDEKLLSAIRNHIAQTGTPVENLTIPDVLALLPSDVISEIHLMENSRSVQKSSPEFPRAIMFAPNGSFAISFNGDPNDREYQSIEMLQYDPTRHVFELGFLRFPLQASALDPGRGRFRNLDTSFCHRCHHAARGVPGDIPVFDHLNRSRGAYGRTHDVLLTSESTMNADCNLFERPRSAEESTRLAASFLGAKPSWKTHERYQHIRWQDSPPTWPYADSTTAPYELRPTFRFVTLLAINYTDAIVSQLLKTPAKLNQFSPLYFWGHLGCDEWALETAPEKAELLKGWKHTWGDMFDIDAEDRKDPTHYMFFFLMGMDPHQFTFSNSPSRKPVFGQEIGIHTTGDLIAGRLLRVLNNEALRSIIVSRPFPQCGTTPKSKKFQKTVDDFAHSIHIPEQVGPQCQQLFELIKATTQ